MESIGSAVLLSRLAISRATSTRTALFFTMFSRLGATTDSLGLWGWINPLAAVGTILYHRLGAPCCCHQLWLGGSTAIVKRHGGHLEMPCKLGKTPNQNHLDSEPPLQNGQASKDIIKLAGWKVGDPRKCSGSVWDQQNKIFLFGWHPFFLAIVQESSSHTLAPFKNISGKKRAEIFYPQRFREGTLKTW